MSLQTIDPYKLGFGVLFVIFGIVLMGIINPPYNITVGLVPYSIGLTFAISGLAFSGREYFIEVKEDLTIIKKDLTEIKKQLPGISESDTHPPTIKGV